MRRAMVLEMEVGMAKTVKLSVHRNTVEKRRRKVQASEVLSEVGRIMNHNDIRAYAFVAIDAKGASH